MFNSLVVAESSPNPGWDVGQRLVAGYFTGEHSLSCTVEVLGQAFLAHPELQEVETLEGKVVSLLGAVADGYATALRTRTLNQRAVADASGNFSTRTTMRTIAFVAGWPQPCTAPGAATRSAWTTLPPERKGDICGTESGLGAERAESRCAQFSSDL